MLNKKKSLIFSDSLSEFILFLQLSADFLDRVTFDDITRLDVVVTIDVKTAFKTCTDFFDIVFVTFQ